MKLRVPLWLALIACLASATVGMVRAQDPKEGKDPKDGKETPSPSEYPYLPTRYGEAYIPSVADWQAIRLTALGASTTRLTDDFNRQHLTCFATPKGLFLTLDLAPRESWKFSAPGGKFTVPAEKVKPSIGNAVDLTMRFVRNFFSEVRDKDVSMRVYINSELVGVWENGALTLNAEKPQQ